MNINKVTRNYPDDYDQMGWDITGNPNASPFEWALLLLAVVAILAICSSFVPASDESTQLVSASQVCVSDCGRW